MCLTGAIYSISLTMAYNYYAFKAWGDYDNKAILPKLSQLAIATLNITLLTTSSHLLLLGFCHNGENAF